MHLLPTLTTFFSLTLLASAAFPPPNQPTQPASCTASLCGGIGFMITAPDWHPLELTNLRSLIHQCGLFENSWRRGPLADEQHGLAFYMCIVPNNQHDLNCVEDAIDNDKHEKLRNAVRFTHRVP